MCGARSTSQVSWIETQICRWKSVNGHATGQHYSLLPSIDADSLV